MTDTSRRGRGDRRPVRRHPTAWAGWVVFAGVMLIMLGTFQIIEGLVALFDDGFYLVGSTASSWTWTTTPGAGSTLVIGVVGVLAGIGLLAGNMAARVVGVAVAFLSALVNLAFISAYPVWSAIMIILDVIVIYAIIVHGRELKGYYR